jgi:lipid A 3-O-deacylase
MAAFSLRIRRLFSKKGRTLSRLEKPLVLALFTLVVSLGVPCFGASSQGSAQNDASAANNPAAEVREARSWEYGPFAFYGNGLGERSQFRFFAAGMQLGKPLSRVMHASILSGQFEFAGNIMPIWQAYTPAPHYENLGSPTNPYLLPYGGGTFTGVSLTPVILRWNFLTSSRRFQPWFQGAGGLIYTTHKFPPDVLLPHGYPGGTSVWNFSPQGGIGLHYFTRSKRSVDFGVNAVHISSASLGDRNPGVNASVQFQLGYTFWR